MGYTPDATVRRAVGLGRTQDLSSVTDRPLASQLRNRPGAKLSLNFRRPAHLPPESARSKLERRLLGQGDAPSPALFPFNFTSSYALEAQDVPFPRCHG